MNEIQIKSLFAEAEVQLAKAEEELCRPQEDIVAYSVYEASYQAVIDFLAGYLSAKGFDVAPNTHPKDLLNACIAINPVFESLSIAPLMYTRNPDDRWMNMDVTNKFIEIARNTRSLVLAHL